MFILVTGGAASGKSQHAERLLCERAREGSRLYLATMQPFGAEAQARMLRHHALRAGKGFQTVERYTDLAHVELPEKRYDGILLECLSTLLANEIFSPDGAGEEAVPAILQAVDSFYPRSCQTLVVVTNEIFSDGIEYPAQTMQYMKQLAQLNAVLAQKADVVVHSVCGILLPLKGADLL